MNSAVGVWAFRIRRLVALEPACRSRCLGRWAADDWASSEVRSVVLVLGGKAEAAFRMRLAGVEAGLEGRGWPVSYTHLTLPTIYSV